MAPLLSFYSMEVYIVIQDIFYGEDIIEGVYSSKQAADTAADKLTIEEGSNPLTEYRVECHTVI